MTTNADWTSDDSTALFEAVLSLRDVGEAERFFRDLCTMREIEEMTQRWAIARLLAEGRPYREIAEATASSTATVTRIAQWLRHGEGGYRLVLDRLGFPTDQETT
ncbi:MAG: YerC/YecD family TrpR-related protein [Acidimicrobiia bacterium]|nr:YerC/YecD family TrpR-related protein [Acidimicrobiia bacterium]